MAEETREFKLIDVATRCFDGREKINNYWNTFEEGESFFSSDKKHSRNDFKISPTSPDDLRALCGNKWKTDIRNLGQFVSLYKYVTSRRRITELPISSTTGQLVEMFGTVRNVSKTILPLCIKVGLLVCVNKTYQHPNKMKPKKKTRRQKIVAFSRRYIYNKSVEDVIIEAVKKYGIELKPYTKLNRDYSAIDISKVSKKVKDLVRISPSVRIELAKVDQDERKALDIIRAILDEKYPQVVQARKWANEDNQNLNEKEQIKAEWNLSLSRDKKFVTGIGFRMTNGIVSLKNHENGNENYSGVWRKEYLEERFGKWFEYDVKSSIYRVTYFVNFGDWLDSDIDLYEVMYGKKFEGEQRTAYKVFKMRQYFDKQVMNHIKPVIKSGESEAVKSLVAEDLKWQKEVIGESLGSEVFVHESCIYMDLVHRLRSTGFDVVQVYDGFYSDSDIREKAELILSEVVSDYKSQYLKKIIKSKDKNKSQFNKIREYQNNINNNICVNSGTIHKVVISGTILNDDINLSDGLESRPISAKQQQLYDTIVQYAQCDFISPNRAIKLIKRLHPDLDHSVIHPDPYWTPSKSRTAERHSQLDKLVEQLKFVEPKIELQTVFQEASQELRKDQ